MTTEALLGTDRAFAADLIELRPQPGQAASAANLRRLLEGSAIVASHRTDDPRVQDAYSIRCTPQVHGAARDTVAHAEPVAEPSWARRSTTRWCSPTAGSSRAATSTARRSPSPATSSRSPPPRSARSPSGAPTGSSTPTRSHGLPPFLAHDAGVDSGLMIAQYTQAAMVAENRRLAAPASVDSLPTSAMQEDHVSMGWGAARKLRPVVANLRRILAVELACAGRGLELRAPLEPARGTGAALTAVRDGGPRGRTRPLARPRARRGRGAAAPGALMAAVEAEIGELA